MYRLLCSRMSLVLYDIAEVLDIYFITSFIWSLQHNLSSVIIPEICFHTLFQLEHWSSWDGPPFYLPVAKFYKFCLVKFKYYFMFKCLCCAPLCTRYRYLLCVFTDYCLQLCTHPKQHSLEESSAVFLVTQPSTSTSSIYRSSISHNQQPHTRPFFSHLTHFPTLWVLQYSSAPPIIHQSSRIVYIITMIYVNIVYQQTSNSHLFSGRTPSKLLPFIATNIS